MVTEDEFIPAGLISMLLALNFELVKAFVSPVNNGVENHVIFRNGKHTVTIVARYEKGQYVK
jgi:hypothetical protein